MKNLVQISVLLSLSVMAIGLSTAAAPAQSMLLIEADSGKILHADKAAYPWYPASVTKVMTAYVTLRAVKEGRLSLDKLFTVSANAVAQQPSKMGFPIGTQVTVDNALKMLMVKSANDVAVVLAEGVSGSIEAFAEEMNRNAKRLGMTQSRFVNPNGLPDDEQVTSARDMALLTRAIYKEMPEYELYWRIPAIKFGRRILRNYNRLIDRYPGADGMKTGFICASGFNIVVSATRNGRRLIAVIMGAPSGAVRAEKAAQLLERGFAGGPLAWLRPSLGNVEDMIPVLVDPPNLREQVCGKNRKRPASEADVEEAESGNETDSGSIHALAKLLQTDTPASLLLDLPPSMPPIVVYTGPKRTIAEPALVAKKPSTSIVAVKKPTSEAKPLAASAPETSAAPKSAAKPVKKKDNTAARLAVPDIIAPSKPAVDAAAKPKPEPKKQLKPAPKPKVASEAEKKL